MLLEFFHLRNTLKWVSHDKNTFKKAQGISAPQQLILVQVFENATTKDKEIYLWKTQVYCFTFLPRKIKHKEIKYWCQCVAQGLILSLWKVMERALPRLTSVGVPDPAPVWDVKCHLFFWDGIFSQVSVDCFSKEERTATPFSCNNKYKRTGVWKENLLITREITLMKSVWGRAPPHK